jgi:hypothetical protein
MSHNYLRKPTPGAVVVAKVVLCMKEVVTGGLTIGHRDEASRSDGAQMGRFCVMGWRVPGSDFGKGSVAAGGFLCWE